MLDFPQEQRTHYLPGWLTIIFTIGMLISHVNLNIFLLAPTY